MRERGMIEIQGHRGWRGAWPENTLEGFRATWSAGLRVVELDVGLTRDGVPVVCHDPMLDPALTRGPDGAWIEHEVVIHRTALAELRRYDVGRMRPGSAAARTFPDQRAVDGARVPTLAEVLACAPPDGVLDIEIKTDPTRPVLTAAPEDMVKAVLALADGGARVRLRSFDWRVLAYALPRIGASRLSWLTDARTAAASHQWWGREGDVLEALRDAGAAGGTWAPHVSLLTPARVAQAHADGIRVAPWTVNEPQSMRRLAAWGVDALCTDYADRALAALR